MVIDPNVQLAAAGDMAAFEEVYRTYHRRVYTHCLRMTRNVAEAEDLTQEVFIQVFRKLKTFRGESLFTTWLHLLTVNAVLMHFRKLKVRPERTTDDGEVPNKFPTAREWSSTARLIDRITLNEALAQLSPGYRAVFILHDLEGYEHHQISEILGCAVGTSKSQLHKARFKLRRLLKRRKQPAARNCENGRPRRAAPTVVSMHASFAECARGGTTVGAALRGRPSPKPIIPTGSLVLLL